MPTWPGSDEGPLCGVDGWCFKEREGSERKRERKGRTEKERERETRSLPLYIRVLTPSQRPVLTISCNSNGLPEDPPPNITPLEDRASTQTRIQ